MSADPSGTRAPQYLNEPLRTGTEINVTGKWVPRAEGGFFRKSPESDDLLKESANIHADARAATLLSDFGTTSAHHAWALLKVAKPGSSMSAGTSGWKRKRRPTPATKRKARVEMGRRRWTRPVCA